VRCVDKDTYIELSVQGRSLRRVGVLLLMVFRLKPRGSRACPSLALVDEGKVDASIGVAVCQKGALRTSWITGLAAVAAAALGADLAFGKREFHALSTAAAML
jgi:hypothetical protein